jgi:hypothetical protein
MSVDVTFMPVYATTLVGTSAIQAIPAGFTSVPVDTFRCKNINAARQYLGWGTASATAIATAPTAAVPQNNISIEPGQAVYLNLQASIWFISSAVGSIEVTPGIGGSGAG